MTKTNKKKTEATDPAFDKVRISILIPGDILSAYKAEAKKTGEKYQAMMNKVLKAYIKGSSLDPRVKEEIMQMLRTEMEQKKSA